MPVDMKVPCKQGKLVNDIRAKSLLFFPVWALADIHLPTSCPLITGWNRQPQTHSRGHRCSITPVLKLHSLFAVNQCVRGIL